jgi:dolichol-phosphate mannosyltransferase
MARSGRTQAEISLRENQQREPLMLLSVIVPCFNEEAVLPSTHERLMNVLRTLGDLRFEIIYVDDGSRDQTQKILAELQAENPEVRVLKLSRNFGHQVAVTAGLEQAAGDALVVIDADLQDPPEVIPEMVQRWLEGNHVAYASRIAREGESRFKLWTAKAFYRFINRISDTRIPVDTGDFRLMDREVVDVLLNMPERGRFLRGMVSWVGFRQIAVPYYRAPRPAGESKYHFFKMLRFAIDGITSFSMLPLKLAAWTGMFAVWAAVGVAAVAVFLRLFGFLQFETGWISLLVAVLFMGGIQLVSLGIIGEYLGRIYSEVKQRPLYVVEQRLGFEKDAAREVVFETHERKAKGAS